MTKENISLIFQNLKKYCEKEQFKGYDPFDGLNSKVFRFLPILRRIGLFQLLWIQFFKRSPINFRRIAGIDKEYNPKGLGLFLSGYCNLYKIDPSDENLAKINFLVAEIKNCQSVGYSGACWGYNFDWQSKAFFQPKGTPSVVVSSFIGCALLDSYEITNDPEILTFVRTTCNFILNDLNRTYDSDNDFSFSYSPEDKTQVFNASLLGVRLLSRIYFYTKESLLIEESRKAVSYVCKHQQSNGAWAYSPLPFHSWIDNFHTGYNLECIYTYQLISGDTSFSECIDKGLHYYLTTFFEESGMPRYYNNSLYPIDMHTTAQLIVTLSKMNLLENHIELVDKVLNWSISNMRDKKQGYFYYYKEKYFTIKIPYMRWIQAWMFLGFTHYQLNITHTNN
ncbi:MAG: delta-aminolevulinic acid dehydratase [Bacteroidales bacterium]|nr:delta-aminolevulinic acid dehydratase [Bacteroidales bacterium]